MRLTHQQLLVSQPTNMHEYQFQQNDRACTQSKAVESDPYQPLTLVAAHPRKKRSTRLPEVPLRQSHPFRSSQDHLDLGFDVSTCSKTAQQEQYSGSMYDENGDAMEESDSIRSHRCVQDRFLVMSKLSGMSYKEIKSKGHFREAESTLVSLKNLGSTIVILIVLNVARKVPHPHEAQGTSCQKAVLARSRCEVQYDGIKLSA